MLEQQVKPLRLTNKQLHFIDAIVQDPERNRTHAAIAAGTPPQYASMVGYEWWNKEHVRAEIERRLAEQKEEQIIHRQFVLENLRELIVKCMGDERWNPASANAALRTCALILGLINEKKTEKTRELTIQEILPAILKLRSMLGLLDNASPSAIVQQPTEQQKDLSVEDYLAILQNQDSQEQQQIEELIDADHGEDGGATDSPGG